jgi:hypothetical protein
MSHSLGQYEFRVHCTVSNDGPGTTDMERFRSIIKTPFRETDYRQPPPWESRKMVGVHGFKAHPGATRGMIPNLCLSRLRLYFSHV